MSVDIKSRRKASLQQDVLQALRQAHARIEALELAKSESLAIIGMACRFPGGSDSPEAFWRLLHSGTDAITEVPADRWQIDALYDADPEAPGKMMTRWGGFLQQVDQFDPQFFGISPREAASMDPQQRLVLEVGWEALERAGLAPDTLAGSQTGVFLGASTCDYSLLSLKSPTALEHSDIYLVTGSATNIIAGRLSYVLGLQGPSLVVDTACSSSLVSVHLACQSLRSGECDLALAGGVNLILIPELSIMFSKAHMLAADGRCKTFDEAADGFARGEGCGIVVLRRLGDAIARGDTILALIRGGAVNQDGRSSGLTAPNGQAQQAVIRKALANAHVAPAQVGYVEAHGTGTSLGDPIEMQALAAVLSEGRAAGDPVHVGAVKTNVGHLEAASGMAGLIKAVLALQHQEIPPNLHLHTPNPYIPWDELPVTVPARPTPWPVGEQPRIAGVSSFGFSGTNAHLILQEAPLRPLAKGEGNARPLHLLCLSAKSEGALQELAGQYARYLSENPSVALADITHTANSGRAHFPHRAALIASSQVEMRGKLAAFSASLAGRESLDGVQYEHLTRTDRPPLAFLFTGQGAQYAGMGRRLYETLPTFRKALEQCEELLRPHLKQPLLSVLYPAPGQATPLDHTSYTQPALFALEYALAQVWRSWGVTPSAVLGHSVGEYVAACVAGIFGLEDGLRLIAERGRLMGDLPLDGAMAAVFASEAVVAEALAPYGRVLAIAAINSPQNTVISGAASTLEEASAALRSRGIRFERLTVSHAFHSPLMEPMLDALEQVTSRMHFAEPHIELVANLTGQPLGPKSTLDGHYWRRQAREPVRFEDGMASLSERGYRQFIEIGPGPVLLGMGQRCLPEEANAWMPSLRKKRDDWQTMLGSLSSLYVHGAAVNWENFDRDYARSRVTLPTYPFQRQRYWVVERDAAAAIDPADKTAVRSSQPIEDALGSWLYRVEWQLQPPTEPHAALPQRADGRWVILADRGCVGQELARLFTEYGASCDLHFADTWEQNQDSVLPDLPACRGVIHLLSLDATAAAATTSDTLRQDQERACASTLRVVKALATSRQPGAPRLWIVTRGTQTVGQEAGPPAIAQAPIWGLGKVIALEHPELWGGLIDLDPSPAEGEVERLLGEICTAERTLPAPTRSSRKEEGAEGPPREDQVAWRHGQRYVARLVRSGEEPSQPLALRPAATYAITGGAGGLGGIVAGWMAQQGVRHIALIGRNADAGSDSVRALESLGVQVLAIQADVSQAGDVARALNEIAGAMPPLRGIIHAAGVLDDGALLQQDWTRFERVLAPKVAGAWNLHSLTQTLALDFFVCFSSTASLFGSPGQGSYAAANAFLDGLAHYRQANGLPSLTINWGPWDKVGMAAAVNARSRQRWADRGIELLAPFQGLQALASLLRGKAPQVTVMRIDALRFFAGLLRNSSGGVPALFAELSGGVRQDILPAHEQHSSGPHPIEQFLDMQPDQRPAFLRATLGRRAGHVLGMAQQEVAPDRNLLELGMDSLMIMEVIQAIKQDFLLTLYPRELYEHPSIDALAAYLNAELVKSHEVQSKEPATAKTGLEPLQASLAVPGSVPQHANGNRPAPGNQERISAKPGTADIAFLLSGPRSGSTLLRVMLAGHPRLFCPPELHLLPFDTLAQQRQELGRSYLQEGLQRALMELLGCDATASKALLDTWIAEHLSISEVYARLQRMAAPRLLVDKSPTYAGSAQTLRRAEMHFAAARYICLVRHPYATIESFARNRMDKLMGADNGDAFLLAEQVWVQTNQNMLDFLGQVDAEQRYIVRYEDLVKQPEEMTDGICAFLGIPPDRAVLQPYDGQRMTDGVHGQSLAIGDPNFLDHDRIDPELGEAWKKITLPHPLGQAARQLAAAFEYDLREQDTSAHARSLFAVNGLQIARPEGGQQPAAAVSQQRRDQPGAAVAREYYALARGLRLCLNSWGPEDGPTIVCLHGILDHGMAWEEVAASLAGSGYRTVAPDQRGHGRSMHAPATGAYHLLDYVADLDALLRNPESGIAPVVGQPLVLVGHSMGAAVASLFASLYPQRVGALVLIEGLMPGEPSESEFANLLALHLQYLTSSPRHTPLPDSAAAAERLQMVTPSLSPEHALRMAERLTQPCEGGVCWRWDAALLTRADLSYDNLSITPARYQALLARITAPIMLVYGQADNPHLARLRLALPQASVEIVPGGHNLHTDAPAALARAIAQLASQAGCAPLQTDKGRNVLV